MSLVAWFRRDLARNAGQKARSRVFTLGGLLVVTAVLALVTLLVAVPLRRTRERQVMDASREELAALFAALEEYRAVHYTFPDDVRSLRAVGYSMPPSIEVCGFRHVADARGFDDHVVLTVRHRAARRALRSRYPGGEGMTELDAAAACAGGNGRLQTEEVP